VLDRVPPRWIEWLKDDGVDRFEVSYHRADYARCVDSVKILIVAVAGALGALFAVGLVLGALFELQGFGTPRDEDPRAGRLALYALGLAACVGTPLTVWRMLLSDTAPATGALVAIVLVVAVVALLGLRVAR
jgi:hypothetical protein